MMFKLAIQTDGAAFGGDLAPIEIARILNDVAHRIERDYYSGGKLTVLDSNGNTCGQADWE